MSDYNLPNAGEIFSKSAAVTAIDADKIADYQGAASFNIAVEHAIAYGQNFWPQEIALVQMAVSINYSGVYWNSATILAAVLGITGTATSIMDTTNAAGTGFRLTNSLSSVPNWEYLSEVTRSSTAKKLQVWVAAGRLSSDLGFSVSKDEFMTSELGIGCFADAADQVIWIIEET